MSKTKNDYMPVIACPDGFVYVPSEYADFLKARINKLEALINEHNKKMEKACISRLHEEKCDPYYKCGICPLDFLIDLPKDTKEEK